ncbi:hypothetical protein ACTXT7_007627 [Hymenolepis weldensis]
MVTMTFSAKYGKSAHVDQLCCPVVVESTWNAVLLYMKRETLIFAPLYMLSGVFSHWDFLLRKGNLCDAICQFKEKHQGENISAPKEPIATYTFPFNACQRDSQAMRMCYSQPQNTWSSWEPILTPDSTVSNSSNLTLPLTEPPLQFALSRNHIGFRGVVCTSSLSITGSDPEVRALECHVSMPMYGEKILSIDSGCGTCQAVLGTINTDHKNSQS